jgi:hypothetical protein
MDTYNFMVDTVCQDRKPTQKVFGLICNRMSLVTGLTMNEIITYTSRPYSYTFCPAILTGGKKNEHWSSQQVFVLDFDDTMSTEAVLKRFAEYSIKPNIIYYTFSHTELKPRFRVIILLDNPITDYEVALTIRKGLLYCFKEADKKCVNASIPE